MNVAGFFDIQTILLTMGIVMNTLLGILIAAKRRGEFVNRVYIFNIVCIVWWSVMIVIYRLAHTHLLEWTISLYIAPTFIASSFLYFAFYFPEEHPLIPFKRIYAWIIGIINAIIVAMTLTPGIIISGTDDALHAEKIIHFGDLYPLYAFYISLSFGTGLWILARKYYLIHNDTTRRQIIYLLGGYSIASTLAMLTNLVLPYFGYFVLNWMGQVLTVFMVLPVTYAIFKHRLFDVGVIATELITITLWLFLLARLLLDNNFRDSVLDAILFVTMIVIGVLLIRSAEQEVNQRQMIEKQKDELERANYRQETLLHFVTHEIKGYLTKGQGAFAGIVEGDYGKAPPAIQELAEGALTEMRKGVTTVTDILSAANLKKGSVSFEHKVFDLVDTADTVVQSLEPGAQAKGLVLEFIRPATGSYRVAGDEVKIRDHVLRNLLDNAINYTPQGSVRIGLSRAGEHIRVVVSDTGVGITPEDMAKLFTEGGHGKDSIKVNVNSTGYGLFIAKQVVDAHDGKIWAESDGPGKGSRFIVELPATT